MQAEATNALTPNILTQPFSSGKPPFGFWRPDRPLQPSVRDALGPEECERLATLTIFLPPADRALMLEVLREGRSLSNLARLRGTSCTTTRRHVRTLLTRMTSPAFAFIAARRLAAAIDAAPPRTGRHDLDNPIAHSTIAWPPDWSRIRRTAADLCILRGLSARRAAQRSGLADHALRRQVATLHELAREWSARPRDPHTGRALAAKEPRP